MSTAYWQARDAVAAGEWGLAASLYRQLGCKEAAQACEGIMQACERGDAWRARVKELERAGLSFDMAARQARREIYEEIPL